MNYSFICKCNAARDRHAYVCPICQKTSPEAAVRSMRTESGVPIGGAIEWQCPHCEAWIRPADEEGDLIR